MTIADQLIEKGMQQGMQQGESKLERAMMETARFLFSDGKAIEYISRATGLPVEKIKKELVH